MLSYNNFLKAKDLERKILQLTGYLYMAKVSTNT